MTDETTSTPADYRYGANPLSEFERNMDKSRYDALTTVRTPPKLFSGGTSDLPSFTASGIAPELLLKLPYGIRHAAASEPDPVKVHTLFEEYADQPDAEIEHEGLTAARDRMRRWVADTPDPRSEEQRAAADEEGWQRFCEGTGWDARDPEQKRTDIREAEAQQRELERQAQEARARAFAGARAPSLNPRAAVTEPIRLPWETR